MFSSLTGWLKLGGVGILAVSLLWGGFQVAVWRAGWIEATRLNAEAAALQAKILELQAKELSANTERVAQSLEIDRTQTELRAQIADLQEQVKATVTTDPVCDISEDTIGVLNRASGH